MNLLLAFAIFTGIALVGEPGVGVEFSQVAPGRRRPRRASSRRRDRRRERRALEFVIGDRLRARRLRDGRPDGRHRRRPRRRHHSRRHGHARDEAEIDPSRGRSASAHGGRAVSGSQLLACEAVPLGVERTVDAFGLIVGGLATLVESIVTDPTAPPPVRARSASPSRSATSSGTSGRSDALRGGHPVGQPRGREHPAVPAARWRADADDHAQADLRRRGSACAPSS